MTAAVLGLVVTGLVMSVVGSFAPVFAAEAYVVAVALAQPTEVALVVAAGVAAGQTAGKVVLLASARASSRWAWAVRVRSRTDAWTAWARPRADDLPACGATVAHDRPGRAADGGPGRIPGRGPARLLGVPVLRAAGALTPVHRWVVAAMARPGAPLVVALSGAVGLPPLLATTLYAGASTMRTASFVVACATGRTARMVALALAPGAVAGVLTL